MAHREIDEIGEQLNAHFQSVVNPLLVGRGLNPIEDFLYSPVDNSDRMQMCTYTSNGSDIEQTFDEGFIVLLSMPGETEPNKYNSALYKSVILALDPTEYGFTTKATTHATYFPGETEDGGNNSFVVFEVKFSGDLDDCEMEY